jgi:hypothetical protein
MRTEVRTAARIVLRMWFLLGSYRDILIEERGIENLE